MPNRLFPRCWSNHARFPRVPICKRPAIHPSGIVVCQRNSQANSTFRGSPLRRVFKSASPHPRRASPSSTNRSARANSASCTASPKWLGPGRDSTCSNNSRRKSSPPKHQPRSTRLNSPRKSSPRRHSIRSSNTRRPALLSFGIPHSPGNRSTRSQRGRADGPPPDTAGNCSNATPPGGLYPLSAYNRPSACGPLPRRVTHRRLRLGLAGVVAALARHLSRPIAGLHPNSLERPEVSSFVAPLSRGFDQRLARLGQRISASAWARRSLPMRAIRPASQRILCDGQP